MVSAPEAPQVHALCMLGMTGGPEGYFDDDNIDTMKASLTQGPFPPTLWTGSARESSQPQFFFISNLLGTRVQMSHIARETRRARGTGHVVSSRERAPLIVS